ncbi:MAG: antitoxin Xre/MbcA/ParS toxin-binding domain-containing protein [Chitinophagaceae bacterium]
MEGSDVNIKLNKELIAFIKRNKLDTKSMPQKQMLTYTDFLSNRMLVISVIRKGVPYSLFRLIQYYSPFTETEWAGFLDLSSKSLQRYKQSSRAFKPIQSEKIIEMSEVTNVGLDVFEDMDKFKLWLYTPNFSLGSLKPVDLLSNSYGKEMVIGELTRINHGIFA